MSAELSKEEKSRLDELPAWGDAETLDRTLARARVEKIFTAQAPHPSNLEKHEAVINWAQNFALIIFEEVPECDEKNIAMRKLQEATMWANEAISRHSIPEGSHAKKA